MGRGPESDLCLRRRTRAPSGLVSYEAVAPRGAGDPVGAGQMSGKGIAAWRTALLGSRAGAAGWGYRAGAAAATEPTALAALGLLAAGDGAPGEPGAAAARAAADWLAGLQRP